MMASITLRNTRALPRPDWEDLTDEMRDAIDDHALRIVSILIHPAGQVCWTAEFLDVGDDIAIAKAALREIASQPDGGEYAWLGISEVGV